MDYDRTQARNFQSEHNNNVLNNDCMRKRMLLRGEVDLEEALESEEDMRLALQYPLKMGEFYKEMAERSEEIQELVASHFGLKRNESAKITVGKPFSADNKEIWQHGSFNLCIRVSTEVKGLPRWLAFRVPLPFKLGDKTAEGKGNCEEKLRSEAATHIWIREHCPDIPTAKLKGFGLPGGLSFFESKYLSFWLRIKTSIWRVCSYLLRGSRFCEYIPQRRSTFLEHGYIITDWIENQDERLLSSRTLTPEQTCNLYRSMSQIMLSLSRVSQPRIGSWTINDHGQISLSGRPCMLHLFELENAGIPTHIKRNITYTNADSFYLDMLSCHNKRFEIHPNVAQDRVDAQGVASDLVMMQILFPQFIDRRLRNGPFLMRLTDVHPSNVFVDKEGKVSHIIDLEWACSLPLTYQLPPLRLFGEFPESPDDPNYEAFWTAYNEFVAIFQQEEQSRGLLDDNGIAYSQASMMKEAFETGRISYLYALQNPLGLFNIVRCQLKGFFDEVPKEQLNSTLSRFWTGNMGEFMSKKLEQFETYKQEVISIFNSDRSLFI
ncbi:hypothetical protein L228DRAFT_244957 [Xylona heveae TC161]|uniref:Aminoglycoside phosphotransferase domain-containing protein n=1 Tax=Xylona heveae (strain CBS 132557 / TC161) TaxID=1328760 RepID=A0A165HY05_XYLHT|nr:hypothetical protein L228DRAFT_244957 [Xylona heveae TC161]KZF24083.1 hypothetical protein L228DRAFT_244957 [Xylona heveae TC161]